ncbi:MAG TPA: hypothetical protein VFX13_15645 [Gaiellales bacterium]|nr:hypothetical protein [Gaiellales bacterium]
MATRELDVAIVGAGVSGVWCGWRLTGETAGTNRRRRVAVGRRVQLWTLPEPKVNV